MKFIRKKRIILFFLLLLSCKHTETVKVNIIGYPKLENFSVLTDKSSKISIDNTSYPPGTLIIFPQNKNVNINNKIIDNFNKIKISTTSKIDISCKYGIQSYKGKFLIENTGNSINMVNQISINDYFASVLGSEMGDSFSDESLKAQAVAVRTYYYRRKKKYKKYSFDINNADGRDMVYRGIDFAAPRMYKILKETDNLFLVDESCKLSLPLFHSTSSGIILNENVMKSKFNDIIENPVVCYDKDINGRLLTIDSPYKEFSCTLTKHQIIKIISNEINIKDLTNIKLKYFNNTDCVDFMGFIDQENNIHWIKAYKFLSLAQKNNYNRLRSIAFTLESSDNIYYFRGKGFGHLCGMSQYSAEKLAENGYNYVEILKKYYPEYKIMEKNLILLLYNFEYFY